MLTLSLLAMMVAAPVPKDTAPPGPAPRILELQADADGKVRVMATRQVKRTVNRTQVTVENGNRVVKTEPTEITSLSSVRVEITDLQDLSIWTADGKEADNPVAMKKLLEGGLVVVSADGKKVHPKYLKLFRDDVLVLASPDLIDRAAINTAIPRPAPGANIIINGNIQAVPLPAQILPVQQRAVPVKPQPVPAAPAKAEVLPALPPPPPPPPPPGGANKLPPKPIEKQAEEKKSD